MGKYTLMFSLCLTTSTLIVIKSKKWNIAYVVLVLILFLASSASYESPCFLLKWLEAVFRISFSRDLWGREALAKVCHRITVLNAVWN